jgi:hypothetical protein
MISFDHHKFDRRVKIVQMTTLLHQEARDDDVPVWKWLLKVLQQLGIDGMSSDDTDNVNPLETVYRVNVLQWQRDVFRELDLMDEKRIADDEIYAPQGAKPFNWLEVFCK